MKKNIFFLGMAFATLSLVGCSNEDGVLVSNEITATASMSINSRTVLGDDYSTITWHADDKIYLFGEGAEATMRLIKGAGTEVATFTGLVNGVSSKLDKALYPVPSINGNEYSFDLPITRSFNENSEAPLLGNFANGNVSFANLVSMMRIPLSASANDRVLELLMEGIAGKLVVDVENGTATMEAGATGTVTVNVPAGEACFIDIPVPAKTYTTGYTVTVDGNVIAQETGSVELGVNAVKVILNEPVIDDTTSEYQIATTADLLWVAKQVNTGADTFVGKTLVMTDDIDLKDIPWTPIGNEDYTFEGTFDGQNHTIKNLSIQSAEPGYYIGLFGTAENATIKNVTFTNMNVNVASVDTNEGGHIAGVVGYLGGNSTLENITVNGDVVIESSFEMNASSRIAVVVGGNYGNDVTVKNVHINANEGSYVKGNNCVGGIAGQLQVKATFENCSSNIDVIGYKFFAGGIIGLAPQNTTFTNCSTSGDVCVVSGRAGNANDLYRVGAIAGGWGDNGEYPLVLTDCSYTGTISGQDANGTVAEKLDCEGYVGRGYSAKVGTKVIIDGVEYIYVGNGKFNVYGDGFCILSTIEALQAALTEANISEILLGENIVFEGAFKVNRTLTISSVNADNKATIKGRIDISADASFNNIKFDINNLSMEKKVFAGTNYQYPSTANIYAAAASFEGCEFVTDIATGVCGINYGSHAAGKILTVNNCTFKGDFYAIRSRTLFSVTNCYFDIYTTAGKLAAVFTWGNSNSGANSVTFTGNTNSSGYGIHGVQLSSKTFEYDNIHYNVQDNTSFDTLANSINPTCTFTGSTFAEGSETF